MKRVRCMAGAAALSPLAVGLAFPAAAQAATTHSQARGKTVAPAISCTNRQHFTIAPNDNVRGGGWWKISTPPLMTSTNICVGTVDASLKFNKGTAGDPFCKDAWVSAHRAGMFGDTGYVKPAHAKLCGSTGEWLVHGFGVYHSWSASSPFAHVRVVAFSTYNTAGAGKNLSPG